MKKTGARRAVGAGPPRFTADVRERFLGQIEAGRTMRDACAAVGISETTVKAWRARGAKQPGTSAAEFEAKMRQAVDGAERPLTDADVRRALERAIVRKGSVSAMKLWTDLYGVKAKRGKGADVGEEPTAADGRSWIDELAARRRAA